MFGNQELEFLHIQNAKVKDLEGVNNVLVSKAAAMVKDYT